MDYIYIQYCSIQKAMDKMASEGCLQKKMTIKASVKNCHGLSGSTRATEIHVSLKDFKADQTQIKYTTKYTHEEGTEASSDGYRRATSGRTTAEIVKTYEKKYLYRYFVEVPEGWYLESQSWQNHKNARKKIVEVYVDQRIPHLEEEEKKEEEKEDMEITKELLSKLLTKFGK